MEKLYRVVCANFALNSRKPLSCNTLLEEKLDDALTALVGVGCIHFGIANVARYMGLSIYQVEEIQHNYSRRKSVRFGRKILLIQNGMKL